MADNIIARTKSLPIELRLLVYSYIYMIDFEPLRKHQVDEKRVRLKFLPPHAVAIQSHDYQQYRRNTQHHGPKAQWPDHAEDAFWRGIEYVASIGLNSDRWNNYGWNQAISDFIRAETGQDKGRKAVSSHIQLLKNNLRNLMSSRIDIPLSLVPSILAMESLDPFQLHDALYGFLHNKPIDISNDPTGFEVLFNSISAPLQNAVRIVYSREYLFRGWNYTPREPESDLKRVLPGFELIHMPRVHSENPIDWGQLVEDFLHLNDKNLGPVKFLLTLSHERIDLERSIGGVAN